MRSIWGVAVSAAILVGIAGCGSSKGGGNTLVSTATPTTHSSSPVQQLAVSAQQMGEGWTSRTIADGDQVKGQVTHDLCGARYPSESLRIARHQILLSSPAASGSAEKISNEVVIYQPGGAQQARKELLHAIATCPSGPVEGALADEGMVTFQITTLPSDSHWLPGTVAVSATETNSSGQSMAEVAIYQFRGDAMSAVYGPNSGGRPDSTELMAAADAATTLKSSIAATS